MVRLNVYKVRNHSVWDMCICVAGREMEGQRVRELVIVKRNEEN